MRELRPGIPSLVEAHRKNLPRLDRVEPIPWLTISLFSALTILLVAVMACGGFDSARRLGMMLGFSH